VRQLKLALEDVLEQQGAVKPKRVRFFRGQMQTIISRALAELDIKPVPSRRCFSLMGARPVLLLFCRRASHACILHALCEQLASAACMHEVCMAVYRKGKRAVELHEAAR
jgi:hypothetical protein